MRYDKILLRLVLGTDPVQIRSATAARGVVANYTAIIDGSFICDLAEC